MARALRPLVEVLAALGVAPNAVSLSQIPLGFGFGVLVGRAPIAGFWVFLLALILDGVDGALARRGQSASAFGALVDQSADHVRELTVIGGLVAAGALRGEIGVAYAALYPLLNVLVYVANQHNATVPIVIKTWMVFYPFMFVFLWGGPNWLDIAGGVASGFMALGCAMALWQLRAGMARTS